MPYSATENGTKREDDVSDRGKTAILFTRRPSRARLRLPIRAFDWHADIASF
jgi:hypothetical protein